MARRDARAPELPAVARRDARAPEPLPALALPDTHLVVPCYNEAARLQPADYVRLCAAAPVRLWFVDDGSTDATAAILTRLIGLLPSGRSALVRLARRGGRGAAVRAGLLRALDAGAHWLGFIDADFATPVAEVARLVRDELPHAPAVLVGARVRLLGHRIERRRARHLLGRLFASGARRVLRLPIYDTQCAAKFFKDPQALRAALDRPFHSRWVFDVELLGRLAGPRRAGRAPPLLEVPLRAWRDVPGSRLRRRDVLACGRDLARIWWALRHRRG